MRLFRRTQKQTSNRDRPANPQRNVRPSISRRRAELDLIFWTVRESLKLLMQAAGVVYVIASMFAGHPIGVHLDDLLNQMFPRAWGP